MLKNKFFVLLCFGVLVAMVGQTDCVQAQLTILANDGGDKVTQDELRAVVDPSGGYNSVWDGQKVTLFGARNEVASFNLIFLGVGRAIRHCGG